MKYLSIIGSTGSIGTQTLDVVSQHPDQFKVVALVAHHNIDLLEKQIKEYQPLVCCYDSRSNYGCNCYCWRCRY